MATLRTFRALRPAKEYAHQVAALPYDVLSSQEAREEAKGNPFSFLHVDKGEIDLDPSVDLYDPAVYKKAAENLKEMEEKGILKQEEKPAYYLYQLERKGRIQTGIVGCVSIDDYKNGIVKKHELTRVEKEEDRIRHVDACDANTGPIYLTCPYSEELLHLMEQWMGENAAEYDFTAQDGVAHRVWVIDAPSVCRKIAEEFAQIPALYIADGHHRAASAVKVGEKRRQENPGYTGEEEFNYFLSVVFPCEQLTVLPYNRVVKDLNGLEEKAFLGSLKFNFELMFFPGMACKPVEKHCFGVYTRGQWYHLKAYEDVYEKEDLIGKLDVSILQKKVLDPILGIKNPREDKRILYVGGSQSMKELEKLADEQGGAAFVLYPTSVEEIMEVADAGRIMPPKSTWFEPKLRSGLFIHKLREQ